MSALAILNLIFFAALLSFLYQLTKTDASGYAGASDWPGHERCARLYRYAGIKNKHTHPQR